MLLFAEGMQNLFELIKFWLVFKSPNLIRFLLHDHASVPIPKLSEPRPELL